jgi:hypothetical protein
MADRYRVEPPYGAPHTVSRVEAETLLVTLRTNGEPVDGDLDAGFAYTVRRRFDGIAVGRVRVQPDPRGGSACECE